ncbi:MAG: hypothetical protein ACRDRD_23380, partial [Pseudonocardiaceae bacterium]
TARQQSWATGAHPFAARSSRQRDAAALTVSLTTVVLLVALGAAVGVFGTLVGAGCGFILPSRT